MSAPMEQRLNVRISKIVELLKVNLAEFEQVEEMAPEECTIHLEGLLEDIENVIRGLKFSKRRNWFSL